MQGTPPTTALPLTVEEVVAGFLVGTLAREAWTHPAHLFVCRHLVESVGAAEAMSQLRILIPAHNERVGLLPYHGGYHETVTRYFVEAVASAIGHTDGPLTTAALLSDPGCQREAPLRHWSPTVLKSKAARAAWVEPDLEPLPWD